LVPREKRIQSILGPEEAKLYILEINLKHDTFLSEELLELLKVANEYKDQENYLEACETMSRIISAIKGQNLGQIGPAIFVQRKLDHLNEVYHFWMKDATTRASTNLISLVKNFSTTKLLEKRIIHQLDDIMYLPSFYSQTRAFSKFETSKLTQFWNFVSMRSFDVSFVVLSS
jgi:hypothetical protein